MLHRPCPVTTPALAAWLAIAALAATVRADAPGGDVWLISTRRAVRCGEQRLVEQRISFWQAAGDCWNNQSLDALQRIVRDDPRPMFVFIHGNRESLQSAITHAEAVRSKLESSGRKYRLLIWAWPSDRVGRRQRPDVQLKHAYTPTQACYLADLLQLLDQREEICLVGYSFGARIAVEAIARLAANRNSAASASRNDDGSAGVSRDSGVSGDSRDSGNSKRPARRIRLILVAAALDAGDLSPQGRFAAAAREAAEITITRNRFDPALRFYPRMYGRRGPQALGYVGPCGGGQNLHVVDLSCAVGKTHAWVCYAAAIVPTISFAPGPNHSLSATQ